MCVCERDSVCVSACVRVRECLCEEPRVFLCVSVCMCVCVCVCFGRPDTKRHFQNMAEFVRTEFKSIVATEWSAVNLIDFL